MMFVSPSVCLSVCLPVCLSGTSVHCDHTVHVSADLGLWWDNPMFWLLAYRHGKLGRGLDYRLYNRLDISGTVEDRG